MKQLNKTSSILEVLNELKERYENSIEDFSGEVCFKNATQLGLCNCLCNILGYHNALLSRYLILIPVEFKDTVLDCYWFETVCDLKSDISNQELIFRCLKPRLKLIDEAIARYNKRQQIYSGSTK